MKKWNYYNDIDTNVCEWAKELIKAGVVPAGEVDNRSIEDIDPSDLRDFTQCHFFSGLLGWPLALKLAGWPEDRPVWTASLPCQPFSSAGKQRGTADERHLWPVFAELVRECRPATILGEQVSSKVARDDWFTGVCVDLEGMGYAAFGADICAPCAGEVGEGRIVRGDQEAWEQIILGAPHIRQRLYWVASRMADTDSDGELRDARSCDEGDPAGFSRGRADVETDSGVSLGRVAQPRNDGAGSLAGQACHEGRGTVDTGAACIRQDHRAVVSGGPDARSAGGDTDVRMADTVSLGHGECERDTGAVRGEGSPDESQEPESWRTTQEAADNGATGRMADTPSDRQQRGRQATEAQEGREPGRDVGGELPGGSEGCGTHYPRVGDTGSEGSQGHARNVGDGGEPGRQHPQQARPAWAASWADSDTILCADGKARRTQRSVQCLVAGLPRGVVPSGNPGSAEYANATGEARVMRLKGYGNAICAPLAAMFISTCMEVIDQ